MNKLLLILPILISCISFATQSWALPNCSSSQPFDNCYGSHTFATGNTYVGEWQNNKYNGQGTFYWSSGDIYVGEFKNGKRDGQGIYTFVSGDKYVGEFKDDKKNGHGTYYYLADNSHNGDIYDGQFKDDFFHGKGTYRWISGAKYIGEYKYNKRNGQGTYIFPNRVKDVGEFQNGKLNGFATRYDKNGNILKVGIWKDDKFLYTQKKPIPNSNSKLDKYKSFCEEIGFVQGTEFFADCVLEAMKKG